MRRTSSPLDRIDSRRRSVRAGYLQWRSRQEHPFGPDLGSIDHVLDHMDAATQEYVMRDVLLDGADFAMQEQADDEVLREVIGDGPDAGVLQKEGRLAGQIGRVEPELPGAEGALLVPSRFEQDPV